MVSETSSKTLIVGVGETTPSFEQLDSRGVEMRFKAVSADTGGAWSLLEYTAPAGFPGAPPHYHRKMHEAFYVLDGRLCFQLGDERRECGPGEFVSVPPGQTHGWGVAEERAAKFLVLCSPGGFEHYLKRLLDWSRTEESWPPTDLQRYYDFGATHDTFYPPK